MPTSRPLVIVAALFAALALGGCGLLSDGSTAPSPSTRAQASPLANRPTATVTRGSIAVILADEPTGDLDSSAGLAIMRLFRSISAREGVTVIMATHDPAASDIVDATYHLVDGRIQSPQGML